MSACRLKLLVWFIALLASAAIGSVIFYFLMRYSSVSELNNLSQIKDSESK